MITITKEGLAPFFRTAICLAVLSSPFVVNNTQYTWWLCIGLVFLLPIYLPLLGFRVGMDKQLLWKAKIASDLARLIGNKVRKGTKIKIVGGACANLLEGDTPRKPGFLGRHITFFPNYPERWFLLLEKWASKPNVEIEYLVIIPPSATGEEQGAVFTALEQLRKRLEGKCTFNAYVISKLDSIQDPPLRQLATDAVERHFVVFQKPDMLWLEDNHPSGETYALNCEFLDQNMAPVDIRFEAQVILFDQLKKEATALSDLQQAA